VGDETWQPGDIFNARGKSNIIGGNGASDNLGSGVAITAPGNNIVAGNLIGLDNTGLVAIGNFGGGAGNPGGDGVYITGSGTNLVYGNGISGNQNACIYFASSGVLSAFGNGIGPSWSVSATVAPTAVTIPKGVDPMTGNSPYSGNLGSGVQVPNGSTGTIYVGPPASKLFSLSPLQQLAPAKITAMTAAYQTNGVTVTPRNYIGGNALYGVDIEGGHINDVDRDYVGIGSDGITAVPNTGDGVYVLNQVAAPNSGLQFGSQATTDVYGDGSAPGNQVYWGNGIHCCDIAGNTGNGINVALGSTVIWDDYIGACRQPGFVSATGVSTKGASVAATPSLVTFAGNGVDGIHVDQHSVLVTNRQNVTIGAYPLENLDPTDALNNGMAYRNVICANKGDGIHLVSAGGNAGATARIVTGNGFLDDSPSPAEQEVMIRGNWIGDFANQKGAGNVGNGVNVESTVNGRVEIGYPVNDWNVVPATATASTRAAVAKKPAPKRTPATHAAHVTHATAPVTRTPVTHATNRGVTTKTPYTAPVPTPAAHGAKPAAVTTPAPATPATTTAPTKPVTSATPTTAPRKPVATHAPKRNNSATLPPGPQLGNVISGNGKWGITYAAQFTYTSTLGSPLSAINNAPLIFDDYVGLDSDGKTAQPNVAGGVNVAVADPAGTPTHTVSIGDDPRLQTNLNTAKTLATGPGRLGDNPATGQASTKPNVNYPYASNALTGNTGPAIQYATNCNAVVTGNFIGWTADGNTAAFVGNGAEGVVFNPVNGAASTASAQIGGTANTYDSLRNVFVANGTAAAAGAAIPPYALHAYTGVVTVSDNLFGLVEAYSGTDQPTPELTNLGANGYPVGGNGGGGVWLDQNVSANSTINLATAWPSGAVPADWPTNVPAITPIDGSGYNNGEAGLRVDMAAGATNTRLDFDILNGVLGGGGTILTASNAFVSYSKGPGVELGPNTPTSVLNGCYLYANNQSGLFLNGGTSMTVVLNTPFTDNGLYATAANPGFGIYDTGTGPLYVGANAPQTVGGPCPITGNGTPGAGIYCTGALTGAGLFVTGPPAGGSFITGYGGPGILMTGGPAAVAVSYTPITANAGAMSVGGNSYGGGVVCTSANTGPVTLVSSPVSDNGVASALQGGPGVWSNGTGTLTVNQSDVTGNTGTGVVMTGTGAVTCLSSALGGASLALGNGNGLFSQGAGNVTITNLPADNKGVQYNDGYGVAYFGTGSLQMDYATVNENGGPGVTVAMLSGPPTTGTVTLNSSPVTTNGWTSGGVGVQCNSTGALTLQPEPGLPAGSVGSPVTDNNGVGLSMTGTGAVTLTDSAVTGNIGAGVLGTSAAAGLMTLTNSPLTGNGLPNLGGGVSYAGSGGLALSGSLVSTNGGTGVTTSGTGAVSLTNSGVTGNTGAGVMVTNTGAGTVSLNNSAVTNNTAGPGVSSAGTGAVSLTNNSNVQGNSGIGVSVTGTTGGLTLASSTVGGNGSTGVFMTGTGPVQLTSSPVTANSSHGLAVNSANAPVTTDNASSITGNSGWGVVDLGGGALNLGANVTDNGQGGVQTQLSAAFTANGIAIGRTAAGGAGPGQGVWAYGSGLTSLTGVTVQYNQGGGVLSTSTGAVTMTNCLVTNNGITGNTGLPGLSLTGGGTYKVYETTIQNNSGDGVLLGTAGNPARGAMVGMQAGETYYTDTTNPSGGGTAAGYNNALGSNSCLITNNGGYGIDLPGQTPGVSGQNNILSGNIVRDNTGGVINNADILSAATTPQFYFNGLYDVSLNCIIRGQAPPNAVVEIYQAKDAGAPHRGGVEKRLARVTASATGAFNATVADAQFDNLGLTPADLNHLVTGVCTDPATGDTTNYTTNTGGPSQTTSTITVAPTQIQAENIASPQQATITVQVEDVFGNLLAGVPNTSIIAANGYTLLSTDTVVPALGTAQTTSALTSSGGVVSGGTVTAKFSGKDRPGCVNATMGFWANINGLALDPTPAPTVTLILGNPDVDSAKFTSDYGTSGTTHTANGVDAGTLTIQINDDSISACPLSGFLPANIKIVQSAFTTPAGVAGNATATVTGPTAATNANGQTMASVTATTAGTYSFNLQLNMTLANGTTAWQTVPTSSTNPAPLTITEVFTPGPIDPSKSTFTANKSEVLADGGLHPDGTADAADVVTLNLQVVDSHTNAPVPDVPAGAITVKAYDSGTNVQLGAAQGMSFTTSSATDANGNSSLTVVSTQPHTGPDVAYFVATVAYQGASTVLAAQPKVDFRNVIDAVNSTVTVSPTSIVGDGLAGHTSTMTITLKDASDSHNVVANMPSSAFAITPNPSTGITVSAVVASTTTLGQYTATISGTPPSVPVTIPFTVTVNWPAAVNPPSPVAPVSPVTLTPATVPSVTFTVGTGTTIAITTVPASPITLRPNGRDAATITATLNDAANHPVPGATVVISVFSGRGVTVNQPTTTTGAAGTATAGAVTATVTATQQNVNPNPAVIQAAFIPASGTAATTATVNIQFTYPDPSPTNSTVTVTVPSPPLIDNNVASVQGTIQLRDSNTDSTNGDPIPGVLTSSNGRPAIVVTPLIPGTTTVAPGVTVTQPAVATDGSGNTTFSATSTQAETVAFQVTVEKQDLSGVVTLSQAPTEQFLGFVAQSYTPGLQFMGVAATPTQPSPGSVLSGVTGFQLAVYDSALSPPYLTWNPTVTDPRLNMLPGAAFWLQLANYLNLQVVGNVVDSTQPFPVPSAAPLALNQGWNSIGNPYPGPLQFDLANIQVYQNGNLVGPLSTSAAQALVSPYAWRWDSVQGYLLLLDPTQAASGNVGQTLDLGYAMWLLSSASNVAVRFAPPTAARAATRAAATSASWVATLEAASSAGGTSQVFMGAGKPLRASMPPDSPSGSDPLRVSLVDSQGAAASDVRQGPFVTKQTWNVNVDSVSASNVTLSWKGLARALPEHNRLYLVDQTNGKRLVMNSTASYQFASTGGTRQFTVELDPHGTRTLNIAGLHAGAMRRGSTATTPITVTLTCDAQLVATVKGLGGHQVRQFQADGTTGTNTLSWNGLDDSGRAVPAGMYMLEVEAFTPEGEVARQTANLSVH
jgi:hypothetical protein